MCTYLQGVVWIKGFKINCDANRRVFKIVF